jgi:hypothetical protein
MSLFAAIRKLWQCIAPRSHGDVEEELSSHLAAYEEDLIREGLTPQEAHRKRASTWASPPRRTKPTATPSASALDDGSSAVMQQPRQVPVLCHGDHSQQKA